MIPIHQLLNRIRWDKDFARGDFQVGYFDRIQKRVIIVPFRELDFSTADARTFTFIGDDGQAHRVPLHRIREVYKDGMRIWHRRAGPPA